MTTNTVSMFSLKLQAHFVRFWENIFQILKSDLSQFVIHLSKNDTQEKSN